jgi:molecular chaperone DnaK
MKAAKEKLMESAQKVFAKVYEQAQAAQGAQGAAGPDMGGAGYQSDAGYQADDVVDGDYKEV